MILTSTTCPFIFVSYRVVNKRKNSIFQIFLRLFHFSTFLILTRLRNIKSSFVFCPFSFHIFFFFFFLVAPSLRFLCLTPSTNQIEKKRQRGCVKGQRTIRICKKGVFSSTFTLRNVTCSSSYVTR